MTWEMLAAVRISAEQESLDDTFWLRDHTDGSYEKARRVRLIEVGLLTTVNAPGMVPLPCPSNDDYRWEFLHRDHLEGSNIHRILLGWYNLFYPSKAEGSAGLRKAEDTLVSCRAYYSLCY